MADEFTVEMKGLREIEERLTLLGSISGARVMRSTLFRASRPLLTAAQQNATRIQRSGALAKSIRRVYLRGVSVGGPFGDGVQNRFVVSIAPKAKDRVAIALANLVYRRKRPIRGVFWGHLVEWGFTHKRSGRRIPGKGIFTAAARSRADESIALFAKYIRRNVDRAMKKQGLEAP